MVTWLKSTISMRMTKWVKVTIRPTVCQLNLRTCGRVDSVSKDMNLINEFPYPNHLLSMVFSQMRNLKQELMLCQLFIIFHKGQT